MFALLLVNDVLMMNGFALALNKSYQKILSLAASTIALSMMLFDSATFPIIIPTLQNDLGFSMFQVQWLINSFFLSTAVLVIVFGKLADIIGRRTAFCIGLALFALANLGFGFSSDFKIMLVARIVQGIAAAMLGPTSISIIFDAFPSKERGRAMGIGAGFSSLFMSVGPFLGAILIEFHSWRVIFLLFSPLAAIGILLALLVVPENKKKFEKIDFLSFVYIVLGISAIVIALMQFKVWKGGANFKALIGVGLFFTIALYRRNRKQDDPFIDFSLFKNRYFSIGLFVSFLTWVLMTNPIFWSIFLQKSLHYTPVETASYMVISTLPVMLFAPASGLMYDKMGAQTPILLGFMSILISVFVLILFTLYYSILCLVVAFCCFGIGTSLILTPISNLCLSKIAPHKRGLASGIYNTMRFLGSSFGVAVIGYIGYHCRISNYLRTIEQNASQLPPMSFKHAYTLIQHHPETIDPTALATLKVAVNGASFAGFSAINIFNGFIVICALLLTLVYLKDYRENS
ncbi:MAG: MFS transporter [Simkaniaceae bacterium]|nr:MFS transporter [Simkaniaceae bacterium]